MVELPEHEKLKKVQPKSQAIGEFLDWLNGVKKINLCLYHETETEIDDEGEEGETIPAGFYPIRINHEALLAEYFGIDLKKLEAEKQQILDDLQKAQKAGGS